MIQSIVILTKATSSVLIKGIYSLHFNIMVHTDNTDKKIIMGGKLNFISDLINTPCRLVFHLTRM